MRAVIQRVAEASVTVDNIITGKIGKGILLLLAIGKDDTAEKIPSLVQKIIHLRIFDDDHGRMNISLKDSNGSVLLVSQFTLYGDCKKGRRPDFTLSAPAEKARALYDAFRENIAQQSIPVETGVFGAMMNVSLVNHGPVTFILET